MRWTIALLAAVFAAAASANDVGQIKMVRGTVYLERDGQRLAAKPGMGVRQADTLVTGADGAVGVTFLDNSLDAGFRPGMGNIVPDRFFWALPPAEEGEAVEGEGAEPPAEGDEPKGGVPRRVH